jgi:hypothetical protein
MIYNYADLQKYADQLLQVSSVLKSQIGVEEVQTASRLLQVIAKDLQIVSQRLRNAGQTV